MKQDQVKFTQIFRPYNGAAFILDLDSGKKTLRFTRIIGVIEIKGITLVVSYDAFLGGWAVVEASTGARMHGESNLSVIKAIERAELVFYQKGLPLVQKTIENFRINNVDLRGVNTDFSTLALQMLQVE